MRSPGLGMQMDKRKDGALGHSNVKRWRREARNQQTGWKGGTTKGGGNHQRHILEAGEERWWKWSALSDPTDANSSLPPTGRSSAMVKRAASLEWQRQNLSGRKLVEGNERRLGGSKRRHFFLRVCCKGQQRHEAETGGDRGPREGLRW